MDFGRLELFLRFVATGSVSAAARQAHLTQPAVSRNLHELESELGVSLFARRGRGLILTAAGRSLVPRARTLLEQSEQARREVARCAQRDYFDLRLGTIDSVAAFLLPQLVVPLCDAFPELAIKLSTARTATLLERVRSNALDFAIVSFSGAPSEVRAHRLGAYHLQFWGLKKRYPKLVNARTQRQLASFPIVEIEPPPGAEGLVPEAALSYAKTSSVASVKALVLAGFGVGDLPDFMLTAAERKQLVRAPVPHDPDCGLYLVAAPEWTGATEQRLETEMVKLLRKLLVNPIHCLGGFLPRSKANRRHRR